MEVERESDTDSHSQKIFGERGDHHRFLPILPAFAKFFELLFPGGVLRGTIKKASHIPVLWA